MVVLKKAILTCLIVSLCLLMLTSCGQSKEAKAVDDLIKEIGEVSIDSEECIVVAEQAYEALEEKDKNQVVLYDSLTAARASYNILKADFINSELNNLQKKNTLRQSEVDSIDKEMDNLSKEALDLIDIQLYKEATAIRPIEKSAIVAANALKLSLKNPSNFSLTTVAVKEGISVDGRDVVRLQYSASNSSGTNMNGIEYIEVDRGNWSTEIFDLMNKYLSLNGDMAYIASLKSMLKNHYAESTQDEVPIDAKRVMQNVN